MKRKEHIAVDHIVFGKGFDEVHAWMDDDAKNWFGTRHSIYNHWLKNHSVETISEKYDIDTIEHQVALYHVVCDWLSHFGEFRLPMTREFIRRLLIEKGVKLLPEITL